MEQPARRFALSFSPGSLIGLVVLVIVLGGGLLLLFRWILVSQEISRRRRCESNLAALATAVYLFHDDHGALPPAVLGREGPTWGLFLWPYRGGKGEEAVARRPEYLEAANRFDFRQNCLAPSNADVLGGMTWRGFFCPSRRAGERQVEVDALRAQPSDYASVGPTNGADPFSPDSNAMLVGGTLPTGDAAVPFAKIRSRLTFEDVTDGRGVTAMIGEKQIVAGGLWNTELSIAGGDGPVMLGQPMYFQRLMGSQVDRSLAQGPNDNSAESLFGSWHPGVCLFAMGDMSVKVLSNQTDRQVLSAYAGRNDAK